VELTRIYTLHGSVGEASANERRQKWRLALIKKQLKRELVHEMLDLVGAMLEYTRPVRHRFGLRESNLRGLKSALTFAKPRRSVRREELP